MMFEALKLPVLILSTPRSGSTALAFDLLDHFKMTDPEVILLNEPKLVSNSNRFNTITGEEVYGPEEFIDIITSKKVIIKTHANDINTYPDMFRTLIATDHFSTIRIRRRNLIEQCVSYYIGRKTGKWLQDDTSNSLMRFSTIEIDRMVMMHIIDYYIPKYNKAADSFTGNLALDLIYEDCVFASRRIVRNEKVANYDEIRDEMSILLMSR